MDALKQIAHLYEQQPEKLLEYAGKLEKGLKSIDLIQPIEDADEFHKDYYKPVLAKWKKQFDKKYGGYNRAPKFMMPNNFEFLMRYAYQNSDKDLMEHCLLTLDKISWGGVYDPIGGGFSRYSVDEKWHVPHFEKMLYDNAQLVQLYSKAFKITKNEWYKEVVEDSLNFIKEELTDASGAFYSALDADSLNEKGKNEEGAFYTWSREELKELLKDDFPIFEKYYNINNFGKWEANSYVLIRTETREKLAQDLSITEENLITTIKRAHKKLKPARENREKPGLDDKSLTSWNAMMISGYVEAYNAFGKRDYLEQAEKNAQFVIQNQIQEDGRLYHSFKNGKSSINAYLEDYAFSIEAFLNLYEASFDPNYLNKAEELINIVEEDFLDTSSQMFYFTSKKDRALITKTIEISDNVIPASNSVMAKNLFRFGKLSGKQNHIDIARKMLQTIQPKIQEYPQSYSNWLDLMMDFTHPFYEIAITGNNYETKAEKFRMKYLPNSVLAATNTESELPLFKDRLIKGKDLIYVCQEGSCQLPTDSETAAMQLISQV